MKHDILNHENIKIGELELPDDASQSVINERLAVYALPPAAEIIPNVTPRQIRQALILSGVTTASIEAALDSLPEPMQSLAKIEWEYSTAFERNRPLVNQMASMLGWTSAQLDALWKLAGTL